MGGVLAIRSVEAAPVELTVPQHRILVLLETRGPASVGALAAELGADPSNGTRMCDRLQRLRLVERHRNEYDRRNVTVELTDAGRDVLEVVGDYRRREFQAMLSDLDDHDVGGLSDAVTLLADRMRSGTAGKSDTTERTSLSARAVLAI